MKAACTRARWSCAKAQPPARLTNRRKGGKLTLMKPQTFNDGSAIYPLADGSVLVDESQFQPQKSSANTQLTQPAPYSKPAPPPQHIQTPN